MKILIPVMAVGLIFAVTMPVSAVAKRGYFVTDPSSSIQAQIRGSDGYVISLSGGIGFVFLAAKGHHATVQYLTKGVAGKGTFKAKFGNLGRVALRFHPRGKARLHKNPESNCRGGGSLVQSGVFVGKLDFEGEQDYTAIHTNRIKGTVTHTKRQVCKNGGSEEGERGEEGLPSSLDLTFLNASDDEDGSSFNAFKIEPSAKPGRSATSFDAMVEESSPGLLVTRSIQATAEDSSAFSIVKKSHGHVDEATVTPPAPFSGSATYRRAVAKRSETWAGTLAGDFPGLGTVSLAGPEFCAEGVLLKGCNGPAGELVGLFGRSAR
ncbi:MAG TPA: hypothetical protein VG816_09315 [Solirubrobacterales bacterium]|nr:hypothetical protein [Solirubrobacterales bacterium]